MSKERRRKEKYIADCLGMIDYDHFIDFKRNAAAGMYEFGNNFIRALSTALIMASDEDAVKIIRIWQNDCTQCEMMYRIKKAKEKSYILSEEDGA